jgi:hypothetical protein
MQHRKERVRICRKTHPFDPLFAARRREPRRAAVLAKSYVFFKSQTYGRRSPRAAPAASRPYDLRRFGSFQTLVGRATMSVCEARPVPSWRMTASPVRARLRAIRPRDPEARTAARPKACRSRRALASREGAREDQEATGGRLRERICQGVSPPQRTAFTQRASFSRKKPSRGSRSLASLGPPQGSGCSLRRS